MSGTCADKGACRGRRLPANDAAEVCQIRFVAKGNVNCYIGNSERLMSDTSDQGIPAETVERVRRAFLILDGALLAELEAFEPKTPLSAAFIKDALDGLRSVTSAGSLPFQLVSHSVQQRRFDALHTAERILSLKDIEHGQDPSPERNRQSFQNATARMNEFVGSGEGVRYLRDEVISSLDQRLNSPAVSNAAFELLVQSLISTWAVFESSVRAFVINWINAHPQQTKFVLASPDLKQYFGKQVVDINVIGEHAFDLTSSMGDILFGERRLDNLSIIRSVFEALFNSSNVRSTLAEDMWMLNQRRHLFVHRRGSVDAEYLGRTNDAFPIGARLAVTSSDIKRYIRAVQSAFVAIASAADTVR